MLLKRGFSFAFQIANASGRELTSEFGTTRTSRHVCYLAAFGGKAEICQRIAERDL